MPPDSNLVGPLAIGASLFGIVLTSTLVGSSLPFVLSRLNQDPANAGTTVQVFMDVQLVLATRTHPDKLHRREASPPTRIVSIAFACYPTKIGAVGDSRVSIIRISGALC